MEEVELHDWSIFPADDSKTRRNKSIEAYYLNNWIDKIRPLTFRTVIFDLRDNKIAEIPDVNPLQFDGFVVRYEHRSPKDSDYWGKLQTKDEIIKVFETSLRCRMHEPGNFLCVREYKTLEMEYRCFYNHKLVAVGVQSLDDYTLSLSECERIIKYFETISEYIPYKRCVVDIAVTAEDQFILIEFNSWETNSGPYPFDWQDDTSILYNDKNYDVVFKSKNDELVIHNSRPYVKPYLGAPVDNELKLLLAKNIIPPAAPGNYIVTDKYIYITTDIWLGIFDLELNPLSWKRGIYRFDFLELCSCGKIKIGNEYLDSLGQPVRHNNHANSSSNPVSSSANNIYRYGFYSKLHDQNVFCRMDNDGNFWLPTPN